MVCRWIRYVLFLAIACGACFFSGTIYATDVDFSRIVQTVDFKGVDVNSEYLNELYNRGARVKGDRNSKIASVTII